jgi:glycosyltransferase involved in cell wall biosynthesis
VTKVGIITYYWPPAGGPGVQRWLKLTKYLARMGVEVHVVTVNPDRATYPLRDEGLRSDVAPAVKVYATDTAEKFGAYKKVTGKKQVPFSGFSGEEAKVSLVQKVARFVRGNFFVPDARKGWNSFAFAQAAEIIKEHDVKHWITTSPPHSSQLVGLRLQKEFGVHWTADFRDPWTDIYYYRKFYPTAITRWYEGRLERKVFSSCDALISVSPSWSDLYAAKGAQPAYKVHTITNGFDAEDFVDVQVQRNEIFTITYAGTLAAQYPVGDFVAALNRLSFDLRLRIIGSWDQRSKATLEGVGSHVELEFVEYVPKAELNAELVRSHLMLFLLPGVESATGHVPGKLFDYLGCGNPILGLGPVEGDAARIIQSCDAGTVLSYGDVDAIAEALETFHNNGAPRLIPEKTKQYERSVQAAQVLDAISRS